RLAGLLQHLLRAVDLRIADVMPDEAVRVHREEDRALAAARVLKRTPRRLVDRLDVLTVDLDRLHSEGDRALGHIFDRHVLPGRGRLSPVVVLADEDGWNLPELRHVERLVEGADVRGAVAEESDRDTRLCTQLERQRRAGDRRQAAP